MLSVPIRLDHRPETLIHQARWLMENYPDRTAVVLIHPHGEQRVTYHEFFTQAMRYAAALQTAGVQPKDLIVSVLQHGETVLYSFWGAMLLGAVPSIFPFLTDKLDHDRYFESVRELVQHAGVKVVITNDELKAPLDDHLANIPSLAGIINAEQLQPSTDALAPLSGDLPSADDTAFLQHSSGSTGLQKGVMLSHRSVLNQVASYSAAIDLQPDDVIVSWLPLYHDMGLIAAFVLPILQGIPLILMSPFHWVREPQILPQAISKHGGTLCWLPNFAYNFLATRIRDAALEGIDLSSLRAVINCSEPVHADSHRVFAKRFAPYGLRESALMTCYAMAENTFAVTQSKLDTPLPVDIVSRRRLMEERIAEPLTDESTEPMIEFVSCGYPVINCAVRIMGDTREILPERHVGEIALRSDSMLSGYYNRQDLTEKALIDQWYYTGDMGYLADGELYITGRKKDLIIVGGKNIYPQDIENLLNIIPGIHPGRTVAFGIYNPQSGTEDMAVLAEVDQAELLDNDDQKYEILRAIRSSLAQNTDVIARYVQLVPPKWLIKTSSGKIARTANREKFLDAQEK